MKRSFRGWLLIASCVCLLSSAAAPAATPELKLERVVMLMRHGIRPPTSAQPIPVKYSPMAWPRWSVGPGLLTPRGAKGIALLAAADRAYFIDAGLLPASGCPATGQVTVRASKVPRAIETAKAWSNRVLPGCDLTVRHPAKGAPDPLFHILDNQPAWFDGHRAYEDALAQAPNGGLVAQANELAPQLQRLGSILGCVPPACDLKKVSTTIVERPHGRPEFQGPLDAASTASESFLLEYAEGMPMSEVGWGRVSRGEIERLLIFNSIKFNDVDRPSYIAQAAAGPLARAILEALRASAGSRITLLAGHDTNIADLGGLLGMHWHAASYPADAVPPGSALGFELLSDGHGRQFVRAFFRSQTMDQLRNLEPLSSANRPYRGYVAIPGCGSAEDALSCDLPTFTKIVEARLR
jgi:4-phytase/acid phosphatase